MTTIDEFVNSLEMPEGNMTEPNGDFNIQECVEWYYENNESEFWKSNTDKKLDYNTLLELLKDDYTQESFDSAFNECMKINKLEGKNFKESIVSTMQAFEQSLMLNEVTKKMAKYISSAIVMAIISEEKQDLNLIATLIALIIQGKITPDNLSDLNDVFNKDE